MRSFDTDPTQVVTAERGQRVHRSALEHTERLARRLYEVRPGVWNLVGNGLSNQTFIDAPDGIIAIDTGESNEEMRSAVADLRQVTDRPIAAVIYSHFHYVNGTEEIFREVGHEVPVYAHEKVGFNRSRAMSEIGPSYSSGLVHQFGTAMPLDGPDGIVSVGLGIFYRNPDHHPFTGGYVPANITWRGGETTTIAGLKVEVTHAPSDADDSLTLWFPEIATCVHNIVWPVLFNVFAIRGEEYRDPQILVRGIDHVLSLGSEYLVGTHGPPIVGADEIRRRVTGDRDSIQFMWDQTVRTAWPNTTCVRFTPVSAVGSTVTRPSCSLSNPASGRRDWSRASVAPTKWRDASTRLSPPTICAGLSNSHRGWWLATGRPMKIDVDWRTSCAKSDIDQRRRTFAIGASPRPVISMDRPTCRVCGRTDCANHRCSTCPRGTHCEFCV